MSFSALDIYNAILAITSFQIARGRGQLKRQFNARAYKATSSQRTQTRLEQLAETFASGLRVSCKTFAVPWIH
jgi:hypothetical protein